MFGPQGTAAFFFGGGPPAEGCRRGAAARTALGHRRRLRRGARGGRGTGGRGIDWGGDTSGYHTKPQKTIQSSNRLHKAPTDNTKPRQTYTKT